MASYSWRYVSNFVPGDFSDPSNWLNYGEPTNTPNYPVATSAPGILDSATIEGEPLITGSGTVGSLYMETGLGGIIDGYLTVYEIDDPYLLAISTGGVGGLTISQFTGQPPAINRLGETNIENGGTLAVSAGATVTIGGMGIANATFAISGVAITEEIVSGLYAGVSSLITLNGEGATLDSTQDSYFGVAGGTAIVDITNGATFSDNLVDLAPQLDGYGNTTPSSATINVSGTGSALDVGTLLIAANGLEAANGTATLSLVDGGEVNVTNDIAIGNAGTGRGLLLLSDGTINLKELYDTFGLSETIDLGGSGLNIDPGSSIVGTGLIAGGDIFNESTISAEGGTLTITGSFAGDLGNSPVYGTLDIGCGSELILDGSVSSSQIVQFNTSGVLSINNVNSFYGTISNFDGSVNAMTDGFSESDLIFLQNFVATSNSYILGTGLVLAPSTPYGTLDLTGNFSANAFDVTTDGTNTTIALFDQIGAGTVTVGTGSIVSDPSIAAGGDVSVQSGGTVSNALIAGGTLELGVGSAIIGDIGFSGQGGVLIIDGDTTVPNTIAGLTVGDTIELAGVAFVGTGGAYGTADEDTYTVATAGTLSIDADGTYYNLIIAGITVGQDNFVLSADLGITETACYAAGTHIATAVGEMKVEELEIGDLVETLDGSLQKIKWIGRRSYDGRFIAGNKDILPIRIAKGAIGEEIPSRDLFVSPGHAICIDNALIHAFRLVNGVSIKQIQSVETVIYYHIETENHEVIFAENCPAETFLDENFRAQFQNAPEFRALYPDHVANNTACLPLLQDGFALHAIQQRLNARAGILPPPETHGALRGYVDEPGPAICSGWAQDVENPETPVCLDILVDGARVARVLANFYRADLREAGLGSGCHAFRAALPAGYAGQLHVRRATDGTELPWTETALGQAA